MRYQRACGKIQDGAQGAGASDKTPPERPLNVVLDKYPAAFVPPFHYDSPK